MLKNIKTNENEQNGEIFVKTIIRELKNPNNSVKDADLYFEGNTICITFFELSTLNVNWFVKFLKGKQFENEIVDLEIGQDSPEAFSGYVNKSIYINTVYNYEGQIPFYVIHKEGSEIK